MAVIEFALANQIVVVQDAAHAMFSYDAPPLSFLQVPGAREVGVEFHSLSKGWNMIGWRIGWVCGHPRLVRAGDVNTSAPASSFPSKKRRPPRWTTRKSPAARAPSIGGGWRSWWPRSTVAASIAGCPAARISFTPAAPRPAAGQRVPHC